MNGTSRAISARPNGNIQNPRIGRKPSVPPVISAIPTGMRIRLADGFIVFRKTPAAQSGRCPCRCSNSSLKSDFWSIIILSTMHSMPWEPILSRSIDDPSGSETAWLPSVGESDSGNGPENQWSFEDFIAPGAIFLVRCHVCVQEPAQMLSRAELQLVSTCGPCRGMPFVPHRSPRHRPNASILQHICGNHWQLSQWRFLPQAGANCSLSCVLR
jgi:hypothetical protein